MRRVAIISMLGRSNSGGVERVVARHAALLRGKYEVRIVSLPERGWLARARQSSRYVHRLCQALFPLLSWAVARMWAGRDGLVLSHGFSSIGVSCDAAFAHGCWAQYTRSVLGRSRPGMTETYERLVARFARRVVSVSEDVAQQWSTHYGLDPRKSRVAHNRIDTAVFAPVDPTAKICSEPVYRVLFVGRLEPGKGLDWLDRLHQALTQKPSPFSVHICSPTPPPLEASTRFPLFKIRSGLDAAALAQEYNRADLFLLPSLYEAFELSSIEALACGTPVLLNPTGSRTTLHQLGCPAVYDLETASSPWAALNEAVARFRGMQRRPIADWVARHFDGRTVDRSLAAVFAELERR